jgi:hypothetical protein
MLLSLLDATWLLEARRLCVDETQGESANGEGGHDNPLANAHSSLALDLESSPHYSTGDVGYPFSYDIRGCVKCTH